MYIHVPVQPQIPASAKAQELGSKVAELVRILRKEDPEISRTDVEQGLALATAEMRRELGGGSGAAVVMLVLAVTLAVGILAFFIIQGTVGRQSVLWILAGLAIGLLVAFTAVKRRRSKS